jgi:Leucine-rich repeat (LRR) protein
LSEVERFDWDSDVFQSFEPLYKLKKLVHLGFGFRQPQPKIGLGFLKDFNKTLESLDLQGDYKDLVDTIANLKLLKSIRFASTKLSGFDFLENLPIEAFGNYGSRVGSFEYLKNLPSLKKIWIKANSKIDNIDFIEELHNLEEIELLYVSKIRKLPGLTHLKKLKKVLLFECNRIEDIEEIKQLEKVAVYASGKMIKGNLYKNEKFNW